MKKYFYIFFAILLSFSCRKSDFLIDNESVVLDLGGGTGNVTWEKDKTYLLDGFVFVNDGQTLNIEAGTIIRARTGQGSQSSALIVARGAKIIAQGTSQDPIIFTVEGDDLEGSVPLYSKGLWGGIILLGNAPVNSENGESFIEGIPISEPRGIFGGNDENDNSGILEYVTILHGGTNIGEGNEINGLTLGGIGRKTIINHVEIISNADDGVEFFGGTVNCSNLLVAFCGDDAFDFDMGYSGKCQFLLAIHDTESGHYLSEHSGFSSGSHSDTPTSPFIYNASFIEHSKGEGYLMSFDKNSGGQYKNSIFLNSSNKLSIKFESEDVSFPQISEGKLSIENNIFFQSTNIINDSIFEISPEYLTSSEQIEFLQSKFTEWENEVSDPGLNFTQIPYSLLPPDTVFGNMAEYNSEWFEKVSYKGAFGSNNWLEGWSFLWKNGIIE